MTFDLSPVRDAHDEALSPCSRKLQYRAPELLEVGTAEAIVQGSGCRSGFDYTYTQPYCW